MAVVDMEHVTKGDSLLLQDRYSEAMAEYQQVDLPEAQAHLALCYLHLGRLTDAQNTLEAALVLHPEHPSLLLSRAKVLFYAQDFAGAKRVFAGLGEPGSRWVRKCELQGS